MPKCECKRKCDCKCKEPCKTKCKKFHCPQLKLTDALTRQTEGFSAPVSISKQGDRIYVVYDIDVTPTVKLAAELFKNNNGKLISLKQKNGDANFSVIDAGAASPDFCRFTFLDDAGGSGFAAARIRLFDENFNVLATHIFNDYFAPGFSAGSTRDISCFN